MKNDSIITQTEKTFEKRHLLAVSFDSGLSRFLVEQSLQKSSRIFPQLSLRWRFEESKLICQRDYFLGKPIFEASRPKLIDKIRGWQEVLLQVGELHKNDCIHGNLKSSNIIATWDNKIHLVDGYYRHFLPDDADKNSIVFSEDNFYKAPELIGLFEGVPSKESDLFSVAGLIAQDLGLLSPFNMTQNGVSQSATHLLQAAWGIYTASSQQILLNGDWFEVAHPEKRTLKNIANALKTYLEPHPGNRARSIDLISNVLKSEYHRLEKNTETPLLKEDLHVFPTNELPKNLGSWVNSRAWPRIWAPKDTDFRPIVSNLIKQGFKAGFMRIEKSDVPYGSLDKLVANFLNRALTSDHVSFHSLRRSLRALGGRSVLIGRVLPSYQNFFGEKTIPTGEAFPMHRHEELQNAIDELLVKLMESSGHEFVAFQDLHSCDAATQACLARLFSSPQLNSVYFILSEATFSELQMGDPKFSSASENRIMSAPLTDLGPDASELLQAWLGCPFALNLKEMEFLASKILGKNDNVTFVTSLLLQSLAHAGVLHLLPSLNGASSYKILLPPTSKLPQNVCESILDLIIEKSRSQLTWHEQLDTANFIQRNQFENKSQSIFTLLNRASESSCDRSSTAYIVDRFNDLKRDLSTNSSQEINLRAMVQERLGDLAYAKREFADSSKYYTDALTGTADLKRKTIISFKAFMPSLVDDSSERQSEFINLIAKAEHIKLLPRSRNFSGLDPNLLLEHEIRKIDSLLRRNQIFGGASLDNEPLSVVLSQIKELSPKVLKVYRPRSKAIRESVFAKLLRDSAGWIDNSVLLPQLFRCLKLTIKEGDGPTITHCLLTTIYCAGRSLRPEVRAKALDYACEVASYTGNDLAFMEATLLKTHAHLFFDGQLEEAREAISTLTTNFMPKTLKVLAHKYLAIINYESNLELVMKKSHAIPFKDLDLMDWQIGLTIYEEIPTRLQLYKSNNDALLSSLLQEELDQILLYSFYCLEEGASLPTEKVNLAAKRQSCREWFADSFANRQYVPELVAQHWSVQASEATIANFACPIRSAAQSTYHPSKTTWFKRFFSKKQTTPPELPNWASDLSVELNLKLESFTFQDFETFHTLAEALAESRWYWMASRICKKAGLELLSLQSLARRWAKISAREGKGVIIHNNRQAAVEILLEILGRLPNNTDEGQELRLNLMNEIKKQGEKRTG